MSHGKTSRRNVSKARRAVFERDGYQCITGGLLGPLGACQGSPTLQHRVGRGMGGSSSFDDTPAYLITLCWRHNVLETENADARTFYESVGWSIPRWVMRSFSIEQVPVCYLDGWALLEGDKRVTITAAEAVERMGVIYGERRIPTGI